MFNILRRAREKACQATARNMDCDMWSEKSLYGEACCMSTEVLAAIASALMSEIAMHRQVRTELQIGPGLWSMSKICACVAISRCTPTQGCSRGRAGFACPLGACLRATPWIWRSRHVEKMIVWRELFGCARRSFKRARLFNLRPVLGHTLVES